MKRCVYRWVRGIQTALYQRFIEDIRRLFLDGSPWVSGAARFLGRCVGGPDGEYPLDVEFNR